MAISNVRDKKKKKFQQEKVETAFPLLCRNASVPWNFNIAQKQPLGPFT